MKSSPSTSPEAIHPSLWRASQLARGVGATLASGYPALSAQLPGGGWPVGALTELLIQQFGTAELRLLQPALASLKQARIVLLHTPYQPQALALSELGVNLGQLLWIRCAKQVDALWAAEQILRSGSCGALLFWQAQIRNEALRRLHLAPQGSETLFFLIRPEQAAQQPSPAPLRVVLRSVQQGLQLHLPKRRGSPLDKPLLLRLPLHPYLYAYEEQQPALIPAPATARSAGSTGMPVVDRRSSAIVAA